MILCHRRDIVLRPFWKRNVRETMLHFLGGPGKEYEIKVTEQDAKKYEETWKSSGGTSPACTLDKFSVFFQGPPASAWNKSAARVLTQHLMTQTYHYPDDDYTNRAILERACLAHIRTMCHTYKASLKPSNVQLKKQKDGNKASRKQKVRVVRFDILYRSSSI